MEASFLPQNSHRIMDEEEEELGTPSSSSSDDSHDSVDSSSSDFMDDATSSSCSCSSSSSSISPSSSDDRIGEGALYQMSSLMAQLPFKRGLSKYFDGKSQSFTSLYNVRCLEDLAKPERPCKKKLKTSKSYGGGLDGHKPQYSPKGCCSKTISKKSSSKLGSFTTSLHGKRQQRSFLGSGRPPIPSSQRSSNLSTQTLLFA